MPRIKLSVRDTDATILRPVCFKVIRDILKFTGITINQRILFPGGTEIAYQPDTTIEAVNTKAEKNVFSHGQLIRVEVDEDYIEDLGLNTAVMVAEQQPIYCDNALGTYIKPVYTPSEVVINFRFRAIDRVSALRWRDEMRVKIGLGMQALVHSATYFYIVPKGSLALLEEIYKHRENLVGYGDTFDEYKVSHFTPRYTITSTLAGTELTDVVSDTQSRIVGYFNFDARAEKGAADAQGDAWVTGFSYTFKYERVIGTVMRYPLVVHNQLLSEHWRPNAPSYREDFHGKNFSSTTKALSIFEAMHGIDKQKANEGLTIPDYDDFIPAQTLPTSLKVLTGLVTIDLENPDILMNLKELGDWEFEPTLLEFIKSESPYVHKPYHSIFTLGLYRNEDLFDPYKVFVKLDSDLNVTLEEPVSLRDCFHVRLGLISDLSKLTDEALDRLRLNACILAKILKAIMPSFDPEKFFKRLATCGYVTRAELDLAIRDINKGIIKKGDGQDRPFNTVTTFYIRAFRKNRE